MDNKPSWLHSLLNAAAFDHPCSHIELIETHASWVILTGDYAYKIKRPVNFGFLDFSTLGKRKFYCEEEIRLNQRLAPNLYIDAIPIHGNNDKASLSTNTCDSSIIDYAVKMKQFDQRCQLDRFLSQHTLTTEQLSALANYIANFHQSIPAITQPPAITEKILQPALDNIQHISAYLQTIDSAHLLLKPINDVLPELEAWTQKKFAALQTLFVSRHQQGFTRECHGDLHLANLALINHQPVAFDCIDFNPAFRMIDVMSELAFLLMDMTHRGQHEAAQYLLNIYLENTGDYEGLLTLNFYRCYRAMVRAKIACIMMQQHTEDSPDFIHAKHQLQSYIQLATHYTEKQQGQILVMRGMSASGKSTFSSAAMCRPDTIRLRSDVERKRYFANDVDKHLYSEETTRKTYDLLKHQAAQLVKAGFSVIIDAANLQQWQCDLFVELASELNVSARIIELSASPEELKNRIMHRENDISDADITVLEKQIKSWQELPNDYSAEIIRINTQTTDQPADWLAFL